MEINIQLHTSLIFDVFMLQSLLSILYYGMETETMKRSDIGMVEAFEMWLYRRILIISWVEKVTNIEVLRQMRKHKEVILNIKKQKLIYLGQIMRGEKYGYSRT